MTAAILTVVALAAGMHVGGDGIDLVGLYALALIVNFTGALWACGVAMRLRTIQAGPMMQMPVFLVLFFAPVYVPALAAPGLDPHRRERQPATPLLEAGREPDRGHAGSTSRVAFLVAIGARALLSVWAFRGLHSAEHAGV